MNGISASPAPPGRHAASAAHVVLADDAAAGVAQRVLEQDLERDGRPPEVDAEREPRRRQRVEPVEVREARAQRGSGAECVGPGHGDPPCGDRAMRVRPRTARYTRCVESYRAHAARAGGAARMRAWDETEDVLRRAAERRDADHEETLRDARRRRASPSTRPRPASTATATSNTRATTRTRTRTRARASGPSSGSSAPAPSGSALGRRPRPRGLARRRRRVPRSGAPRAVPRARHRRPRVRRGQRPGGRRRARDPRRPRRRRRRRSPGRSGCTRARR